MPSEEDDEDSDHGSKLFMRAPGSKRFCNEEKKKSKKKEQQKRVNENSRLSLMDITNRLPNEAGPSSRKGKEIPGKNTRKGKNTKKK